MIRVNYTLYWCRPLGSSFHVRCRSLRIWNSGHFKLDMIIFSPGNPRKGLLVWHWNECDLSPSWRVLGWSVFTPGKPNLFSIWVYSLEIGLEIGLEEMNSKYFIVFQLFPMLSIIFRFGFSWSKTSKTVSLKWEKKSVGTRRRRWLDRSRNQFYQLFMVKSWNINSFKC